MPDSPVLFVSTTNTFRSRFAEAIFNHGASRNRIGVRAISRGLDPGQSLEDSLSPYVEGALHSRHLSLSLTGPTKRTLQVRDLHDALRVIAVNEREHHAAIVQACPDLAFKVDCWQVDDLSRWEPERIIAHLEQECVSLLRSLRTRPIAAVALS